jgi:hypothetical protein
MIIAAKAIMANKRIVLMGYVVVLNFCGLWSGYINLLAQNSTFF